MRSRIPQIEYTDEIVGAQYAEDLEIKFLIEVANTSIAATARDCNVSYAALRKAINGTSRNGLAMCDRMRIINHLNRKAKQNHESL